MSPKTLCVVALSCILGAGLAASGPSQGNTPAPAQVVSPIANLKLPAGFRASIFADNVSNARSMALGPKGTVFVGSRTGDKVYALIDQDGDHRADQTVVIASGLNQPNGVAMRNGALYVATTDSVLRYDDIEQHLEAPPAAVTVKSGLPTSRGGHAWKFIAFGPDDLMYVSVGSTCNVCAPDPLFANIVRMKPDGSNMEVFAEGVRNTVGFDWQPMTREMWFSENGRDGMGDDVPGDELNIAPKAGMHFGFPFCHQGDVADPQFGAQRACSTTEPPVLKLAAHVAALGVMFYTGSMFPAEYKNAVFVAEHGSWNRSTPSGFRVMVGNTNGRTVTNYRPFLDGFLAPGTEGMPGRGSWAQAGGRPVDVLQMPDGSILISDDHRNRIIRVSYGR
jgi:glucose/arabinose dehydrogenase